jgi:uncharacterized membrane protein (DUF485 family)
MSTDTPAVPPSERDTVDAESTVNGRAVAESTDEPSPAVPSTTSPAGSTAAGSTATKTRPVAGDRTADAAASKYVTVAESPDFDTLRRTLRRFVFPLAAAFLIWYALYVLLSAYARDFMGTKVVGNINVALIFGLLQFVSTFLIAWLYARYADRRFDPLAEKLKARVENGAK